VWAWTNVYASNWHPLTWMSHMLDVDLFGPDAGGHHVTSVVLHIANSVLLFMVLRKMTGAVWRSALVAALFGVHPLHVESVAWISERKDVLSGFFFMLTLAAYAAYAKEKGEGREEKGESREKKAEISGNVSSVGTEVRSTLHAPRSTLHAPLSTLHSP